MEILIDVLIIALIVIGGFRGAKKGFVRVTIEILASIVIIPVCILLSGPVSKVVAETTNLDKVVYEYVEKTVKEVKTEEKTDDKNVLSSKINQIINENKNKTVDEVSKIAGNNITGIVMKTIAFIGLYLVLSIILVVARFVLGGIIDSIPLVNQVNYLAGAGMGVIKEVLIILIALLLVQLISLGMPNNKIESAINKTIVTKEIYKVNPLKGFVLPK